MAKKEKSDIVYKYRSWLDDYNRAPLEKNVLYLAPPSKFNDPFDCTVPADFISMNEKEVKEYVDFIIKEHKKSDNSYKPSGEEYNNMVNNFLDLNVRKKMQKKHEELRISSLDEHSGVYSLSSRWDSILIWAHFCIREYQRCFFAGMIVDELHS